MKNDIGKLIDVTTLVNSFYTKVKVDEVLGPIFNAQLENRWPEHLDKMCRFWQTVLLDQHTYQGSPFVPHSKMSLTALHFDRWLELWDSTVDFHFQGPKAERAKWQGARMAEMFRSKITYYKQNPSFPIL